ncbi:MAG: nucleotidyltransferase family protein [Candidatus Margulisiibacteriota bacterium]|jgi:ribosomal protein S15P/S13E
MINTNSNLYFELKQYHSEHKLGGLKTKDLFSSFSKKILIILISLIKDFHVRSQDLLIEEWHELIDICNLHRLTLILYEKLKQLNPPPEILAKLQKIYLVNSAKLIKTEHQLRTITEQFEKHNIDYIVLKGLAFSKQLYKKEYLRPFTDIDILIKPDQFLRAREILLKIGYQAEEKLFEKLNLIEKNESFTQSSLVKIEMHWSIHCCFGILESENIETYFQNKIQITDFYGLHPVDTLIYAAIHLFFLHYNSLNLIWIYDIALLIQKINDLAAGMLSSKKLREKKQKLLYITL